MSFVVLPPLSDLVNWAGTPEISVLRSSKVLLVLLVGNHILKTTLLGYFFHFFAFFSLTITFLISKSVLLFSIF